MERKFVDFLRKTKLMFLANHAFNLKNRFIKSMAKANGKSDIDAIYSEKFFAENKEISSESSKNCISSLIRHFKPKSVIDFGCGPGVYLSEFEKKGVKIQGIDGSNHAREKAVINKEKIIIKDLRNPLKIEGKFDLAVCFEVAEHIDTKYSKNLVNNITQNSNIVAFTAAPPGQGGTDHINEQHPKFWISLFNNHNFSFDKEKTEQIRKEMKEERVVWWIPENIMIFRKQKA